MKKNLLFSSVSEIITDLKQGKPIILVDDEDRENEGDIVFPAHLANYELVRFLVNEVRGLICVPLREEKAQKLGLYQMTSHNTDRHGTAFTVSVDASNTSTGISVQDRLNTILALGNENAQESDFRKPGHIFPLTAKKGGLFSRLGHTEGSLDLLDLAGLNPVSVICEILNDDGTMARLNSGIPQFAKKHSLKVTSVKEVLREKNKLNNPLKIEAQANLSTKYGLFKILVFKNTWSSKEHIALTLGNFFDSQIKQNPKNQKKISSKKEAENILTRIHSSCLTGDVFHSLKCDCGDQLKIAMKAVSERKTGIIIYLNQEGRGIGIANKIKAYALQDQGLDTVEANEKLGLPVDGRDYAEALNILKFLNVQSVDLITNNPKKIEAFKSSSIRVNEIVSLPAPYQPEREAYLKTKKQKLGHDL